MSEERDYTVEVNDHGRRLWPMEFHGWPSLTDQPMAAKHYTERGATQLVRRLHQELPHWAERISVVRHPVPGSAIPEGGGVVLHDPDR